MVVGRLPTGLPHNVAAGFLQGKQPRTEQEKAPKTEATVFLQPNVRSDISSFCYFVSLRIKSIDPVYTQPKER